MHGVRQSLLDNVQHIQIYSSHLVNTMFAGEYHSTFKGRGIEFDSVREYTPGDDIRHIDWKVTARMHHPFVKTFVEERELTVMLAVDASYSGFFGSHDKLKIDHAAELCAVLAFSAIKNNDKVGLIVFTNEVELYIPPKKGKKHVLRVIRDILSFQPTRKSTNIESALQHLRSVTKRRTVTFLISDFLDPHFERALRVANQKHDLIAVTVQDPREAHIPAIGRIQLEDAETGHSLLVNTSDPRFQAEFTASVRHEHAHRDTIFKRSNVDVIHTYTNQSYVPPLIRFFKNRQS